MDRYTIDKLVDNKDICPNDKLEILYKELYDIYFKIGWHKEKATYLEKRIKEVIK
jgi:hypothetical protein